MKKNGFCIALLCSVCILSCDDSEKNKTNHSHAGEACDFNSFIPVCEGDNLIYCSNEMTTVKNCADSMAADGSPRTCASFNHLKNDNTCDEDLDECPNIAQLYKNVDCISLARQCQVEDETWTTCQKTASGITYLRTYKCTRSSDGRLFYPQQWESSEKCYDGYGVCSEDGQCKEPISCIDGYETHCEGNTLYKCNKNRLLSSDCTSYTIARVCSVIDETPRCLSPEKACESEGHELVDSCNTKIGKEAISTCKRAENGNLYYISSGTRTCLNGCNQEASACQAVKCDEIGSEVQKCRIQGTSTTYTDTYKCTEINGEKLFVLDRTDKCDDGHGTCSEDDQCIPAEDCVAAEFTPKCENGTAVNCTSKKVRYNHCELSSNTPICAVVNDKATCFSESDLCSNEGDEIVTRCNSKTGKETVKKCMMGGDGNLYYANGGTRACPNGCNADESACAD